MMGCWSYCRYHADSKKALWRPHFTCLYCRIRRWYYGKLDPKYWRYNRYMHIVTPIEPKLVNGKVTYVTAVEPDVFWLDEQRSYLMFRDPRRRLRGVKDVIFNKLADIIGKMETKPDRTYSKGYLFVRKNFCTLLEMMAN